MRAALRWRALSRRIPKVAFLLFVTFLAVGYIVYPTISTADISLNHSGLSGLAGYADFFSNAINRTAVANTLKVGIVSVLTCGVVGTTLAVYVRFFCKRKKVIQILLMSPVMIPSVIIVVAFMQLYGESGIITNLLQAVLGSDAPIIPFKGFAGIVFVITYTQYVYFYLNIYSALQLVDKNVVESVRSLGGGAFRIFSAAIWPTTRSAFVYSVLTTFASSIGSYSAAALIGGSYRVLTTQIVVAKTNFDMTLASIEVMVLLVIGLVVTTSLLALRRKLELASTARAVYWSPDTSKIPMAKALFAAFAIIQLGIVLLPVVAIFYLSFMTNSSIMMQSFPTDATIGNYLNIFTNKRTFQPLGNSIAMSLQTVLVSLLIALPIALSTRKKEARYASALSGVLMIPWCMPASVIAIGLINAFATPSVFAFGSSLLGTFEILPIAYTIMNLPILLSSSQVAASGIRTNTEEASRSLGAGPARTFFSIALPAMMGGVGSGAILVFVRTMGEYTMSALLYGVFNRPISISIVTNMQEYNIGIAMAYGAIVILTCCILLVALMKLGQKQFVAES